MTYQARNDDPWFPLERHPRIQPIGKQSAPVRNVKNINQNKKANAHKQVVIEGIWANQFILQYHIAIRYVLVVPEAIRSKQAKSMVQDLLERAEERYIISQKTLDSIAESGNPAGIISVCEFPQHTLDDIVLHKNNRVIVLDGLEIPGNVGTIVRSADATAFDAVIITHKKTRVTHPKFIRSSQGACFKIPLIECTVSQAATWLLSHQFQIYLADTNGATSFDETSFSYRAALVMGSERYGISKEWYEATHLATYIPMMGDCDSLNVGIASTVLMYELMLQHQKMH